MSEIESKELQTKPDCKDANLQTTPDYRDVDVQIKPECKDADVQTMADYRNVQIKPECKEVAVQNSPDFWKMQTAETNAETTGKSSVLLVNFAIMLALYPGSSTVEEPGYKATIMHQQCQNT